MTPDVLAKRLARAEAQVAQLERLIEDKSRELYAAAQQLEEIFQAAPVGLLVCDPGLTVLRANQTAETLLGRRAADALGQPLATVLGAPTLARSLREAGSDDGAAVRIDLSCRPAAQAAPFPVVLTVSRTAERAVVAIRDVRRERKLELELRQAQKLEAMGALAAGVAHEINTPIQFVGDSLYFLRDAFGELLEVADGRSTAAKADLPYLVEHVPSALGRCEEGIARVTEIVRALKELSHPDARDKAATDLNKIVQTALIVARNELKHLAEVETRLGALPPVECHAGDVGQLVLNLLVNAAHAIEERIAKEPSRGRRGRLLVTTESEVAQVVLRVTDDGCGIPAAIHERLFEPFFTTKPVGKGTGQGLSIARTIVVERHGGTIDFETEVGVGTTFVVRLPILASSTSRATRSAA